MNKQNLFNPETILIMTTAFGEGITTSQIVDKMIKAYEHYKIKSAISNDIIVNNLGIEIDPEYDEYISILCDDYEERWDKHQIELALLVVELECDWGTRLKCYEERTLMKQVVDKYNIKPEVYHVLLLESTINTKTDNLLKKSFSKAFTKINSIWQTELCIDAIRDDIKLLFIENRKQSYLEMYCMLDYFFEIDYCLDSRRVLLRTPQIGGQLVRPMTNIIVSLINEYLAEANIAMCTNINDCSIYSVSVKTNLPDTILKCLVTNGILTFGQLCEAYVSNLLPDTRDYALRKINEAIIKFSN